MASPYRQPTTPGGSPLYFSPAHSTWFESRHSLPQGSVEAAYRHHLSKYAPEILAELLSNEHELETYHQSDEEVTYSPDEVGPRRGLASGLRRRGAVRRRREGKASSTVALADGSEGEYTYPGEKGVSGGFEVKSSPSPRKRGDERAGRSAWERLIGGDNRVTKTSPKAKMSPRAKLSPAARTSPTAPSPTAPRFVRGKFREEL